MNSVLVTMAPAIEALTSRYSPARSAVSAITSSVRLPSVALSSPPTVSPVLAATDSVAWLSSAASGTMASTDSTNSSVWAWVRADGRRRTIGTNTSSQRTGVRRSRMITAAIGALLRKHTTADDLAAMQNDPHRPLALLCVAGRLDRTPGDDRAQAKGREQSGDQDFTGRQTATAR